MDYNIVTNLKNIQIFKKCEYFITKLGLAGTRDRGEDNRTFEDRDKFAHFYNNRYNTIIYGQGVIGKIMFYVDHYIMEDVVAIYKDENEFLFNIDLDMIRTKGINSYIGWLIREVDYKVEEMKSSEEGTTEEKSDEVSKKVGDPNKIFNNPGQVTWEDLQAYLRNKNNNRI
jgi:hypothetical protein